MSHIHSVKVALVATALLAALAVGCSTGGDTGTESVHPGEVGAAADVVLPEEYVLAQHFELSINVTSSQFNTKRRIPRKYSCTEEDVSPPITWSEVPEGTVSLALVVDSDQIPGIPWVHWIVWGIPPDARGLPEAITNTPEAPSIGPKVRQGTNTDKEVGWSGPCPGPVRLDFHGADATGVKPVKTYSFKLYALDTDIELGAEATKQDLLRAMDGHILSGGELLGEHVSKERIRDGNS